MHWKLLSISTNEHYQSSARENQKGPKTKKNEFLAM